jgi:hypothetical protein
MRLLLVFVIAFTWNAGDAGEGTGFTCSLCDPPSINSPTNDGPAMLFPERIIPGTPWTCKLLEESILFGLGPDDCQDMIPSLPNQASIDLPAYCGCAEATIRASQRMIDQHCSFCSESTATTSSSVAPSTYLSRLPPIVSPPVATTEPSLSPAPTPSTSPSVYTTTVGLTPALSSIEPSFHFDEMLVVDPLKSPPDTGSTSFSDDPCPDLFRIAPFVKDAEYCDVVVKPMEEFCCPTKGIATTCSLCPAGSVMEHPYREIPFLNGDFSTEGGTCQDLEDVLASVSADSCDQARAGCGFGTLDLAAFCGCTLMESSTYCAFCSPDDMLNPDYDLTDYVNYGLTCKGAADLAQFILSDSVVCNDRFNLLRKGCCQEVDRCHMCSDGTDEIAFPSKVMTLGHERQDCADFLFNLGFMDQDECIALRSTYPLDFSSYCGCSGAKSPNECSLCEGKLEVLHSGEKDLESDGGITCGEMEDFVRHIIDPDVCGNVQASIRPKCCAVREAVDPASSEIVEDATISSEMALEDHQSSSEGDTGICSMYEMIALTGVLASLLWV